MYKYDFVLFCKTCLRDTKSLIIQADSIKKYNIENIPYYISVEKAEYNEFKKLKDKYSFTFEILVDEKISKSLNNTKYNADKYINQQIVKLEFYKTNIAKHYLVLDSDCYFIRNFHLHDFLEDSETPYLPITSGITSERFFWTIFLRKKENIKSKKIEPKEKKNISVEEFIGRKGKYYTIEMPFPVTSEYMRNFENDFLKVQKKLSLAETLIKYPCEMQLYCNYVLKEKFRFRASNALFFPNHFDTGYQIIRWLGFDEKVLAQQYLGILMNKGYVKSLKFTPNIFGKYVVRNLLHFHYYMTKQRFPSTVKIVCGMIPSKKVRKKIKDHFINKC